jgi:hypothetical protein
MTDFRVVCVIYQRIRRGVRRHWLC